jgi:hypothetical protein
MYGRELWNHEGYQHAPFELTFFGKVESITGERVM